MAGAVSKKEILDIQGLDADRTNVIETLKAIATAAVELSKTLGDTKGLKDLTAALKALNQVQAEFTKFQKQSIDMSLKAERLKQQEIKTQQQQNREKENSIKLSGQELQIAKLQATIANSAAGSYDKLNAQYKLNIILLQQMSEEERNTGIAAKQMIDQNKTLVNKLNDLDLQNGRTKRSFNGLQWQVTQLARELPSLAYGVNVFFGAIGNNLPMLIDEIKSMQAANKAAAEAGKQTVPVWKQMAGAIFNWQTAVIIAITALTLYGKEIKDWISELFEGTKSVKNMNEAIAAGNETVKKSKQSMQDEIVQMKLRVILATDNKKADDIRIKSANEILSKYPELFKNMTTEQIMTSKSTMLYNLLSDAIAKSFEAKFAAEQISENYRKIAEAQKQIKNGAWWGDAIRGLGSIVPVMYSFVGDITSASGKIKQLKKDNQELFKVFEEGQKSGNDDPFNINAAKSVFESYSKLQTNETKKIFDERSSFISSDSQTYEQWLKNQLKQYANNIDAKIALEQELYDVQHNGGKKNEYTGIEQMQDIHKQELEREKKNQQELLDEFEGSEITKQQIVKENELDILEIRRDQIDEELLLLKKGTEEYAKLLNERAKIETDISKTTTEQNIKIRKLQNKEQQDINKDHQDGIKIITDIERKEFIKKSKDIVDATDDEIVKVQTERTKAAGYEIKQAKGNAAKTKQIQQELTLGMIDDEYKAKQKLLLNDLYRNNLTVEDKKKITSRLVDLEKNRADVEAHITTDSEKNKQESRQQIFDKSVELINAGFDIMQQGYNNQLSRLEEMHKAEVLAAGESVEKRIIADRKYEEEKKKLQRRQAIAEKAQAAFSIALNTAQAIIAIWAKETIAAPVLTALVAALGAAQLAAVLAQPIPAYAKGTKNSKDTFIAGEEKSEIIVTPSGDLMVTPDSATLYSDPKLKGSTVIPHDETTKILANLAMNNTRDIIDMRQTNKHLSNIEKSFKDKDSAPYINAKGKLVVKKGSTTYIYN